MIRIALAAALLLAAATVGAQAQTACPTPEATANPVPVAIVAPKATLEVRVADTFATRDYGLMCVTALPPRTGMIFVFTSDHVEPFWMKNTLIPLDMVFVRAGGRVDSVAANVPSTTPATADADIPRREGRGMYVIELAAGEAAKDGIVRGAKLDLSHVGKAKE